MAELSKTADSNLRNVPSVDQLLRTDVAQELRHSLGLKRLTAIARLVTAEIRSSIRENKAGVINGHSAEMLLSLAIRRMQETAQQESLKGIERVINATGVVLHTNLGRAPLSRAALEAVEKASGYCTLEYDTASRMRGRRGVRVESLLTNLTGAEDALVVNNCAAAALLILKVLAGDGETLVSRGELVEIGGDFRVPDVMASSGTRMVEVGTTNRTHLDDYSHAINSNTRLIMRVHPSNYRVVGFSSSPALPELVGLARAAALPLYEDAGSGLLTDLSKYGLSGEPVVSTLIAAGVDVVSFSGDKLLGSVQAGLIVGRKEIVERLRKHPLYRALRSDKLRLAALEATLVSHQREATNQEIPVIQMMSLTSQEIEARAQRIIDLVRNDQTKLQLRAGESMIGGGAGPALSLPTTLIAVTHADLGAQEIESHLRSFSTKIISRISEDSVLLDLRTVFPEEEPVLVSALLSL